MTARIIGIGGYFAGDDAVGLAVVRHLGTRIDRPHQLELLETTDPGRLVDLLATDCLVVLIDAVAVDAEQPDVQAGSVTVFSETDVTREMHFLSSHTITVPQAIQLARTLDPENTTARIVFVGIAIDVPVVVGGDLSPVIAAAVPVASDVVLQLVERYPSPACTGSPAGHTANLLSP